MLIQSCHQLSFWYFSSDIIEVQVSVIGNCYVYIWLKRCVFNLHLNRVCEKALPPLLDFDIFATVKSLELFDLKERDRGLVKFK